MLGVTFSDTLLMTPGISLQPGSAGEPAAAYEVFELAGPWCLGGNETNCGARFAQWNPFDQHLVDNTGPYSGCQVGPLFVDEFVYFLTEIWLKAKSCEPPDKKRQACALLLVRIPDIRIMKGTPICSFLQKEGSVCLSLS